MDFSKAERVLKTVIQCHFFAITVAANSIPMRNKDWRHAPWMSISETMSRVRSLRSSCAAQMWATESTKTLLLLLDPFHLTVVLAVVDLAVCGWNEISNTVIKLAKFITTSSCVFFASSCPCEMGLSGSLFVKCLQHDEWYVLLSLLSLRNLILKRLDKHSVSLCNVVAVAGSFAVTLWRN